MNYKHYGSLIPEVVASLNQPAKHDLDSTGAPRELAELMDAGEPEQDQWVRAESVRQRYRDLCTRLTPFEREVIRLRVLEEWTLEQIGQKYGRSRERIRQILVDIQKVAAKESRVYSKAGWQMGLPRPSSDTSPVSLQEPPVARPARHLTSSPADPGPDLSADLLGWCDDRRSHDDGTRQENAG